jgi:serine/threonine protein phosphatase PrpC
VVASVSGLIVVMTDILVNWQAYFDNDCKGEDMWGHYKTANGDLYVVADGASNHEKTKTGADVVQFIDEKLMKEAKNISRRKHIVDLMHDINAESAKENEGAYAAVAGVLHREHSLFAFSAGDVAVIGKKPNGKLIQILPLDLNMDQEEAEKTALTEIGTIINGKEITKENYIKRSQQLMNHGLCNAVGIGESFYLNEETFNTKDGAVLLIASDGITDPFINLQKESGALPTEENEKVYDILNSNQSAQKAVEALKDLVWDTQVKDKIKIKSDDRTGIFLYMNAAS